MNLVPLMLCTAHLSHHRRLSLFPAKAIASAATTGLLILFLLGCKHTPPDQHARAAITAVNKLKARVQAGTNRNSYAEGLGDAQFAVNEYLDSDEPKAYPLLTSDLNTALDYYKTAGDLWSDQIKNAPERSEPCMSGHGVEVPACSKFKTLVIQRNGVDSIYFDRAMQSLWTLAGTIVSGLDGEREIGRDLETGK